MHFLYLKTIRERVKAIINRKYFDNFIYNIIKALFLKKLCINKDYTKISNKLNENRTNNFSFNWKQGSSTNFETPDHVIKK